MSISIAIEGQDGSERVVSTNLKTVEFAAVKAAYIAEKLRSFVQSPDASAVRVRVYKGATVHCAMDIAVAA